MSDLPKCSTPEDIEAVIGLAQHQIERHQFAVLNARGHQAVIGSTL